MEGKYNTGVPIDINTISEDERKFAFHEWAEGSEALEELLNTGYENGFLSHACCGGDTGHPYISYDLNDDNSRKMAMHLAQQLIELTTEERGHILWQKQRNPSRIWEPALLRN